MTSLSKAVNFLCGYAGYEDGDDLAVVDACLAECGLALVPVEFVAFDDNTHAAPAPDDDEFWWWD